MYRKILGICMALVALGALAIGPASASAKTHLTDTSGGVTTLVGTNNLVKAIGTVGKFTAGSLTVNCNENMITGTVDQNNSVTGEVKASITKAQFDSSLTTSETDCESSLGATRVKIPALESPTNGSWCLQNGAGDTGSVFGRACTTEGAGTITFILEVTGVTSCYYTRSTPLAGTFDTPGASKASMLTVTAGQTFTREAPSSTFFCPPEGSITEMTFGIYTDTAAGTGTKEWDDAASTADPIWFAE